MSAAVARTSRRATGQTLGAAPGSPPARVSVAVSYFRGRRPRWCRRARARRAAGGANVMASALAVGAGELRAGAGELRGGAGELRARGLELALAAVGPDLRLLEARVDAGRGALLSAGDLATDEAGEERQGEGGERDQAADAGAFAERAHAQTSRWATVSPSCLSGMREARPRPSRV